MRATAILAQEHALLQRVLMCAERYLDERDDAALLAGFERTDAQYAEPGRPDAARLAAVLFERHAQAPAAVPPRPAHALVG